MTLLRLQQDLLTWLMSDSADAAARFGEHAQPGLAVYLNNYRGQLMTCLSESFPIVRGWLGDTAFDRAAAAHTERFAPGGWTLNDYAIEFPYTLDALYPCDLEVGELAKLERALALAFVGLDAKGLDLAQLQNIDWERAMLRLVPTFMVSEVKTNAAAIWSAINDGNTPPAALLLPAPARIAIWRNEFAPTFRTLEELEAEALEIVTAKGSFGDVCRFVEAYVGEQDGVQKAGALLARWMSEGLLGAVDSQTSECRAAV